VASLTKMMTLYTVLSLTDRLKVDPDSQIEIEEEITSVPGTTACLLAGDSLTINQLMYGLMLPSGNDAAHCLAKFFGDLLIRERQLAKQA